MTTFRTIAACALLVLLASPPACDKRGGAPDDDTTTAPDTATPDTTTPDVAIPDSEVPAEGTTLVTFNAGLARNFVPFAEERLEHVIAAIAGLDADVICLQEVWEDGDLDLLLAATAEAFPHARTYETSEEGDQEPACTEDETTPLLACVETNCAESDDLTGCVMDNCAQEFGGISSGCTICLAAHISEPVEDIVAACLTGGGQLLFGGRNGLVLLSRLPLGDGGHIALDSFFTQRAVLWQEVITDAGPLHVFCTHLNAALDEVEYGGPFESWEEEQAHQADQLLAWMNDRAGATMDRVLLGDMNCGPAIPPDIAGEFEDTFAKFGEAGLVSPYLALPAPPCTWCMDNPLTDSETSRVIDHVLLQGAPAEVGAVAARILDDVISVEGENGTQEVPLSDHYGVAVTVL